MKKTILLLLFIPFVSLLNAQRPSAKQIAIPYLQYPSSPLNANIETYFSKIINKSTAVYAANSKLMLEGYQEGDYLDSADLEIKFIINAVSFSSYIKKEAFNKKINDSTYVKAVGGRYVVEARMNYSEFVNDIKNGSALVSNEGVIKFSAFNSGLIKNYNEAVKLHNNNRDRHAFNLYGNMIYFSINKFNNELNSTYGFPLRTYYMAFVRGKGRKFNYSDLNKAYNDFKSVSENISKAFRKYGHSRYGDFRPDDEQNNFLKLDGCIKIWENAIQEYVPNKRKTRIGDKIIDYLYLNLAAAHLMNAYSKNNWDDIYENLSKVELNKSEINKANSFESKVIDIQKRINAFKRRG